MRKNVKIIRSSDERLIDAVLSSLATQNLDDFELVWKPQLQTSIAEDRVWDWVKKERIYAASPNYESYSRMGRDDSRIDAHRYSLSSLSNRI